MFNKLKYDQIKLSAGSHSSIEKGLCVMEAVAYFAGEEHSDRPSCACPVITSFAIKTNDSLPDRYREKMKSYIPLIVGTRDGLEAQRLEILVRAAVNRLAPITLRSAGLYKEADRLEIASGSFGELERAAAYAAYDAYAAGSAYAASAARSAAYAAGSAAYYAAESAAYYAAGSAAASAAESAAASAGETVYKVWFEVLDEIISVGRPDFSEAIDQIEVLKNSLPGEPEFQRDAIQDCKNVFVTKEKK